MGPRAPPRPTSRPAFTSQPTSHRCAHTTHTPAEIFGDGLTTKITHRLFGGGLYAAQLASWRSHMLRPGRALVIDAHAYFRDRTAVMEEVSGGLQELVGVEGVWGARVVGGLGPSTHAHCQNHSAAIWRR